MAVLIEMSNLRLLIECRNGFESFVIVEITNKIE